jgi:hypothetical protein
MPLSAERSQLALVRSRLSSLSHSASSTCVSEISTERLEAEYHRLQEQNRALHEQEPDALRAVDAEIVDLRDRARLDAIANLARSVVGVRPAGDLVVGGSDERLGGLS